MNRVIISAELFGDGAFPVILTLAPQDRAIALRNYIEEVLNETEDSSQA